MFKKHQIIRGQASVAVWDNMEEAKADFLKSSNRGADFVTEDSEYVYVAFMPKHMYDERVYVIDKRDKSIASMLFVNYLAYIEDDVKEVKPPYDFEAMVE